MWKDVDDMKKIPQSVGLTDRIAKGGITHIRRSITPKLDSTVTYALSEKKTFI